MCEREFWSEWRGAVLAGDWWRMLELLREGRDCVDGDLLPTMLELTLAVREGGER